MKYFLLILSVTFLYSCNDESKVQDTKNGLFIKLRQTKLNHAEEIPWYVGLGRVKTKISKGMLIGFDFPDLSEKDLKKLYDTSKIDSYIVRVERDANNELGEFLGYFRVPFRIATKKDGKLVRPQKVRFKVQYAAASVSQRLSNLPCPAFNHAKSVGDFDIKHQKGEDLDLLIQRYRIVGADVKVASFVPVDLNGGMTLIGNYRVKYAFYNSTNKAQMSEFISVGSVLQVRGEENKILKGCESYKVPNSPKSDTKKIENIKFFKK